MASNPAHGGRLTYGIIGLAMRFHRSLEPGLLESIYAKCLAYELDQSGMRFRSHVPLEVRYGDVVLEGGLCRRHQDDQVVLELKSVENLMPVHEARLLTYLRLLGARLDCCSTSTPCRRPMGIGGR
jgi:GxxExxY protein